MFCRECLNVHLIDSIIMAAGKCWRDGGNADRKSAWPASLGILVQRDRVCVYVKCMLNVIKSADSFVIFLSLVREI